MKLLGRERRTVDTRRFLPGLRAGLGVLSWCEEGSWPKHMLVRPEWLGDDELGIVSIGIECSKAGASFRRFYSGVWARRGAPPYEVIHPELKQRLSSMPGSSTVWWPHWRYFEPGDNYWEDLDTLESRVVDEVRNRWLALSPLVDEVVRDAKGLR